MEKGGKGAKGMVCLGHQYLAARLGPPFIKHILGSAHGCIKQYHHKLQSHDLITLILTAPNQWTQGLSNNVLSKQHHPESRFPTTFETSHWDLGSWEDKEQNIKSNIVQDPTSLQNIPCYEMLQSWMPWCKGEAFCHIQKHVCAVDSQETHTTYIYIQRDLRMSGIVYIRSFSLTLASLPFFWAVPLRVQNCSTFDNQVV